MEVTFIVLIGALFLGMLLVNVLFRVRVLKAFKILQQAGIEFDATDMLKAERIEALVRRYPAQESAIRQFTSGIRMSMSLASGLIVLISLLGAILMYTR